MNYFSKNGEEYIVGQEHLYEDPCDEWLDLVNNKLTSPNYPKAYEPLTECNWNLTAPKGYYVTLDFEIIDVSTIFLFKLFLLGGNISYYYAFDSSIFLIHFIFISLTVIVTPSTDWLQRQNQLLPNGTKMN